MSVTHCCKLDGVTSARWVVAPLVADHLVLIRLCCVLCSGSDAPDVHVVTRTVSSSSGEQEVHQKPAVPEQQQHQQPQQQQQQLAHGMPSGHNAQLGSQQSLVSHPSGEGLQRVHSPGPAHAFDAAAYAAAAAARTASPGTLTAMFLHRHSACGDASCA